MLTLWNAFDDRFFDDFWRRVSTAPARAEQPAVYQPAVDINERPDAFELKAELPGMKPEDVEVTVDGNTLTVKGERRYEQEQKEEGYHRRERRYGVFQRSFTLPDTVNTENVGAHLEGGVLTLRLPKREQAKPRKIKVAAQGEPHKLDAKTAAE